jgi:hypothetical protein
MRSRECRRTVLRASADSGQRGHFITSGHVSIQVKSRPEIKVFPCNVGEEISRNGARTPPVGPSGPPTRSGTRRHPRAGAGPGPAGARGTGRDGRFSRPKSSGSSRLLTFAKFLEARVAAQRIPLRLFEIGPRARASTLVHVTLSLRCEDASENLNALFSNHATSDIASRRARRESPKLSCERAARG